MTSLKMKEESLHLDIESYSHIPNSELFKIAKCLPKLHAGGPWIAGGSVWRTVNNEPLDNCDVDVFFLCKEQYEEMCAKMKSYPYVNNVLSEKKNKWNTTFQIHVNEKEFDKTIDVQFIGMSYNSNLNRLLNSFDLSVCQFGYNGKDIIMGEKALSDLQKRQLSIIKMAHPKSFLNHLLKYLNNGFTLPTEELKRVTRQILKSNAWSKNATGKYDEDDNWKMVERDWDERPVEEGRRVDAWYTGPTFANVTIELPNTATQTNVPTPDNNVIREEHRGTTLREEILTEIGDVNRHVRPETPEDDYYSHLTHTVPTTGEERRDNPIIRQERNESNVRRLLREMVERTNTIACVDETASRNNRRTPRVQRNVRLPVETNRARPDEWEGYGSPRPVHRPVGGIVNMEEATTERRGFGYASPRPPQPTQTSGEALHDAIQEARSEIARLANTNMVGRNAFGRTEEQQVQWEREHGQI